MENICNKSKRVVKIYPRPNYGLSSSIFHHIFSFLETPDLCNTRLVCRQWAQTAKYQLGRKGFVTFNSVGKLQEFIKLFQSNRDCYQNFSFQGPFGMNISITEFFGIFGPYVKSLYMKQCIWMGQQLFGIMKNTACLEKLTLIGRVSSADRLYPQAINNGHEIIVEANLCWSNLKTLTLDLGGYAEEVQYWNYRSNPGNILETIYQLIRVSPNVESINCLGLDLSQVVLHIMLLRNELQLKNLKRIDLRSRIRNFELRYMEIKAFPLTSFILDVHPDVSLHVLHNLLSTLGSTLKYLKLRFMERESVTSHYFPSSTELVNLKELALHRFNGSLLFIYDLVALEEMFLDDVCLNSLFAEPRGEPLTMPPGFIFDSMYVVSGGLRCVRDRSFCCSKQKV